MIKLIIKRLLYTLSILIGITLLVFTLANIAPVNPAEAYARQHFKGADDALIEKYNEEFGFNRPMIVQYGNWLWGAINADLGESYYSKRSVVETILEKIPLTAKIASTASIIILLLSIPLGLLMYFARGKWMEVVLNFLSFTSLSTPNYFLSLMLLLIFGRVLKWMPIVGHGHPISIFFAALALGLAPAIVLSKTIYGHMMENRFKDHVIYAKARGIGHMTVVRNHLLRNALPSFITLAGQTAGFLFVGTVIVESIFALPGLGQYALNAALSRDFPVVNGCLLCYATVFAFCNMISETIGNIIMPSTLKGRSA